MSAPAGIMACRLAAVIALALLLAGCDSCGDFVSPLGMSQACRQQPPRPQ
jgi:PBP1b-binding outer membrane lipoprotein LpoB